MEVVNQLTGEVIDVPDEKEIQKELEKDMSLIITDDILETYYHVEALQNQIEKWKYEQKEKIKEIFKKYNVKSFKNDYIEITYVAPTLRKSVDTNKLKQAGIYDEFTKDTEVKESLRVKVV